MKFTEERLNAIIAACQWSSSWFIAAAFLVVLLGVKPPEILLTGFVWTISAAAPLFLTVGLYQVWRLPDSRRYLAIPASAFLILSAVLLFGSVVQQNRSEGYQATLTTMRESVAWKTAKASYDAALSDFNTLAARTFPADYPTEFQKNEQAKAVKWELVQTKAKAVTDLEPAPVKTIGSAFDVFGPQWAWLVFSIFLALYSIVNEAIAMALSHRGKEKPTRKPREASQDPPASRQPLGPFGLEEYVRAAKEHGINGRLAGSRVVAKATGQSEWTCKVLLSKAIELGLIRVAGSGRAPEEVVPT